MRLGTCFCGGNAQRQPNGWNPQLIIWTRVDFPNANSNAARTLLPSRWERTKVWNCKYLPTNATHKWYRFNLFFYPAQGTPQGWKSDPPPARARDAPPDRPTCRRCADRPAVLLWCTASIACCYSSIPVATHPHVWLSVQCLPAGVSAASPANCISPPRPASTRTQFCVHSRDIINLVNRLQVRFQWNTVWSGVVSGKVRQNVNTRNQSLSQGYLNRPSIIYLVFIFRKLIYRGLRLWGVFGGARGATNTGWWHSRI
jgi:hypothetical protein